MDRGWGGCQVVLIPNPRTQLITNLISPMASLYINERSYRSTEIGGRDCHGLLWIIFRGSCSCFIHVSLCLHLYTFMIRAFMPAWFRIHDFCRGSCSGFIHVCLHLFTFKIHAFMPACFRIHDFTILRVYVQIASGGACRGT